MLLHDQGAAAPRRLAVGIITTVAGFLTGVLLFLALTGCGTGAASSAGATQTASLQQRARVVWLDYARCARAHGAPDFPDPQVDSQGHASFPGSATTTKSEAGQVQGACGAILNQLPAAAKTNANPTPAQLRQLVAVARCMRQHGLSQWPDPSSDGTFRLTGTPYATEGKTAPVQAALQACRYLNPSGWSAGIQP